MVHVWNQSRFALTNFNKNFRDTKNQRHYARYRILCRRRRASIAEVNYLHFSIGPLKRKFASMRCSFFFFFFGKWLARQCTVCSANTIDNGNAIGCIIERNWPLKSSILHVPPTCACSCVIIRAIDSKAAWKLF